MKLKLKLIELRACSEAIEWVRTKTLKTAWKTCKNGSWMLWLSFKMKDQLGWSDIKEITLAKVKCARLVQHLMKDQRSLDALDIAERWAKNEAIDEELKTTAAAYDAAYAAADAYAAAYDAAAAARKNILKQCADICRETLKIGKI